MKERKELRIKTKQSLIKMISDYMNIQNEDARKFVLGLKDQD